MNCHRVRIAPSLLAADFGRLAEQVALVEAAGADLLHLDIMDGRFVPNLSFGLPVVEAVRRVTRLPLDTHLMLAEPQRYLAAFRDAGADSLSVHLEVSPDPAPLIDAVHDLGLACCLVLNPATPTAAAYPYLNRVEMVLVMSVEPGFGGQSFQPTALPRIADLRARIDALGVDTAIEVDGGINPETARACRQAGATVLVAGSAVFRAADVGTVLQSLRG